MNLDKMFSFQKELDEYTYHDLDSKKCSLISDKILAFQVQIAKLADETQCFNYWGKGNPPRTSVLLEKYVDCLYYLLSIGLEKAYADINLSIKPMDIALTDHFLNLYVDLNDFLICSSKDHYLTLVEDFFSLSLSLDLTFDMVQEAYKNKRSIMLEG